MNSKINFTIAAALLLAGCSATSSQEQSSDLGPAAQEAQRQVLSQEEMAVIPGESDATSATGKEPSDQQGEAGATGSAIAQEAQRQVLSQEDMAIIPGKADDSNITTLKEPPAPEPDIAVRPPQS
ncbi:MAG: hypothetical protein ABFR97_06485 [Thermodesulfobacteriota bacterium]